MNFITRYKNILGIAAVLVVAFFIYSYFFTGAPAEQVLSSTESATSTESVDQDLIGLLLKLRSITLNDSIFTDPAFQSLQDFGKELVPEPVGRANPFAPLGSISAQSQQGAQQTAGAPAIGKSK